MTPLRWIAVSIVAIVAAFSMWMTYWMTDVLSGSGWCQKAIGADRADHDSKVDIAQSCVGLLQIQLKSLATNSHIFVGMFALVLLVLIVIVIAGGKLDFDLPSNVGGGVHMGAQEVTPVQVVNPPTEPVPVAPAEATKP